LAAEHKGCSVLADNLPRLRKTKPYGRQTTIQTKKKGQRGHYVTRDVRNIKRRCSFCMISCRNQLDLDVRELQRSGFSIFRDYPLYNVTDWRFHGRMRLAVMQKKRRWKACFPHTPSIRTTNLGSVKLWSFIK
jgi:hypothetical protein